MSINELREKLKDYVGTAAFSGFPAAFGDLSEIENADEEQLKHIAERLGFDTHL